MAAINDVCASRDGPTTVIQHRIEQQSNFIAEYNKA
jgi:hypothetical protein